MKTAAEASDQFPWAWFPWAEERGVSVIYDFRGSTLPSGEISSVETRFDLKRKAIVLASEYTSEYTAGHHFLRGVPNTPIVSFEVAKLLKSVLGVAEYQLFPVTVACLDGELTGRYFFVRPLVSVDCVDLEKSSVEWFAPLKTFFKWESLVSCPNCLMGMSLGRDKQSRIFVVSDAVRAKLLQFDLAREYFRRLEDCNY